MMSPGIPNGGMSVRRALDNGVDDMARKVLNRMALRDEAAAAEKVEKADKASGKKEATEKKPRRSRKKEPVPVRVKLFWGVFNQSLKRVALYEYSQRKQADKKAGELSQSGKSPHFVQKVKEDIQE